MVSLMNLIILCLRITCKSSWQWVSYNRARRSI